MLKLFTKRSTIAQKHQMRSLHLKMDLNNDPVETVFLLDQFTNLQHIKLEVFRGRAFDSLSPVERDTKWHGESNRWLFLIIQLRKLPLESAEIILQNGDVNASYHLGNLDPCSFYDFGLNGTMPNKTTLVFWALRRPPKIGTLCREHESRYRYGIRNIYYSKR